MRRPHAPHAARLHEGQSLELMRAIGLFYTSLKRHCREQNRITFKDQRELAAFASRSYYNVFNFDVVSSHLADKSNEETEFWVIQSGWSLLLEHGHVTIAISTRQWPKANHRLIKTVSLLSDDDDVKEAKSEAIDLTTTDTTQPNPRKRKMHYQHTQEHGKKRHMHSSSPPNNDNEGEDNRQPGIQRTGRPHRDDTNRQRHRNTPSGSEIGVGGSSTTRKMERRHHNVTDKTPTRPTEEDDQASDEDSEAGEQTRTDSQTAAFAAARRITKLPMGGTPYPTGKHGEQKLAHAWVTKALADSETWATDRNRFRYCTREKRWATEDAMRYLLDCGLKSSHVNTLRRYVQKQHNGSLKHHFKLPTEALKDFAEKCGFWNAISTVYTQAMSTRPLRTTMECIHCGKEGVFRSYLDIRDHNRKHLNPHSMANIKVITCKHLGCRAYGDVGYTDEKSMKAHMRVCAYK